MMKRLFTIVAAILFFASVAPLSAQTLVGPSSVLTWSQAADTLATAQSFFYDLQIDAELHNQGPTRVLAATCSGTTSPFTCEAPLPSASMLVTHTITVTAIAHTLSNEYPSPPSGSISFRYDPTPAAPTNLIIRQ